MANEWFVQVMGETIGPLSDHQLREMVAKRQMTPDDMVRKGTSATWVPAARMRGLFEQAALSSRAPTTAPPRQPAKVLATTRGFRQADSAPAFVEVTEPLHSHLIACPDCGRRISQYAKSCPNCGHHFFRPNRVVAIALACILGSFGAHKFYLRKPGQAVVYLLFFWIYIPGIVGLIEGFQYLFMDDDKFARLYGSLAVTETSINRPQAKSSIENKRPARKGWIIGVAAFFAILITIGMIVGESGRNGSGRTSSGSDRTSGGSSLWRDTPATINQEVYKRMMDLAVAGDDSGIETLMAAGLAFSVTKGTQVRVIDLGIFTTEIKVESGPYAGRYFIVATENVNR